MRRDSVSPFLDRIQPDTRTSLVVMRWLRFLSDRVDTSGLPRLLEYYRQIDWISGDAMEELIRIAEGTRGYEPLNMDALDEEEVEEHELLLEKEPAKDAGASEEDTETGQKEWRLMPEDHVKSWMFLMELKNEPMDKNTMIDLEQRLNLIESNPEALYRI